MSFIFLVFSKRFCNPSNRLFSSIILSDFSFISFLELSLFEIHLVLTTVIQTKSQLQTPNETGASIGVK